MKLFLQRNTYFLLLVFIFLVAEILINPLGNFPLNDDWSYGQSLVIFYRIGEVFLGNWPAMTLCTQILWGYAFTKVFGFTFFVLRCSTMVSALIGYAFLNRLVIQISGNRRLAFAACLVLMFNPLVFNLTNTFMTDVNFNTLFILCSYFLYNFYRTNKTVYYTGFVLFSIMIVLLRQYGVIFPACFFISAFFVKEKRARTLVLSLLALAIVVTALKTYENYLKIMMPAGASYKYSGSVKIDAAFWLKLLDVTLTRHAKSLIYIFTYTMPVALMFLSAVLKQAKMKLILPLAALSALVVYYLFKADTLESAELFANMRLGDETFYETRGSTRHNAFPRFDTYLLIVKSISSFITLFVISLATGTRAKEVLNKRLLKPEVLFFLLLACAYAFMLMITESYFDRYHIPYITLAIILFSYASKLYRPAPWHIAVPLLFWGYVAMAGTKDYLEWNRQRWKAYWYLRTEMKVPAMSINGGFEVNCWNEGRGWGYIGFHDNSRPYIIQFTPPNGHRLVKEFEFQRYFPYKKDKICIFVLDGIHSP